MKKVLFLAATAAIALSSCSENEITNNVENSRRTPISVSVYSKGQTRAVTNLATLQGTDGFRLVIKAASADDAMFDGACTWNTTSGAWSLGETPLYWPLDETETVSFYALYAPGSDGIIASEDGTRYSAFINIDENAETDIVAAYASKSLAGNSNSGEMELAFSHLLSEIHFAVKGAEAGMTYTVSSITLKGAIQGEVTFGETCSITAAEDSVAYTVFAATEGGTNTVIYDATTDLSAAATTVKDEKGNDVSLMLIPGSYKVSVSYTVANGSDTKTYTKTGTIRLADNAGKKTAATLSLPASRTAMTISAAVSDWTDGTGATPELK